jgi:DNA-binding PadR family transcriptional regulator
MTESEDKTTSNWVKEAQKGYLRIGILIILNKNPSYGYEIMKEIGDRTKGYLQPTPGGVYPILQDLEKSHYIRGQWQTQKNRRLKVYEITPSGEAILKRAIIKQNEIFNNISNLFTEFTRAVLNIEISDVALPSMPSPFSSFLEEQNCCAKNLQQLKQQRAQIIEQLKKLMENLGDIDIKISSIER